MSRNIRKFTGMASKLVCCSFLGHEFGHDGNKAAKDEILQCDASPRGHRSDDGNALHRVFKRASIAKYSLHIIVIRIIRQ